ncbi:MAG: hypothetical protein ACW99Q_11375, partial [Candidatus Kariarchaeaceae archaeon]
IGKVDENPILEYCKYIIFEKFEEMLIERPEKFGGNLSYNAYADLESDYVKEKLHPSDLKKSVAKYINELVSPVRDHFQNDPKAKKLAAFVKKVMKQETKK